MKVSKASPTLSGATERLSRGTVHLLTTCFTHVLVTVYTQAPATFKLQFTTSNLSITY